MNKAIIGVRGQPNSGKTTSIKLAYKELSQEGNIVYSNSRSNATELKNVLAIHGVLVGFASAGDVAARLPGMLKFLLDQGCLVIVCAARLGTNGKSSHKTIDAVERFADEYAFSLNWISKSRKPDDSENENREAAEKIALEVRTAVEHARLVGA
jgi:hypothetical protein